MTLYLIGLGLGDEKDISICGLEAVQKCQYVYLEKYTSKLGVSHEKLEELYGQKIILADRALVEKEAEKTILHQALSHDVAVLVIGDPMSATTHTDIVMRAHEMGIQTKIIHNASIMTAVGVTGLQLYKFGKTASIAYPREGFSPTSHYDILKMNKANNLHTLLLLDIDEDHKPPRYMTVNDGIKNLLRIEEIKNKGEDEERNKEVFNKETFCVGCARIGRENQIIISGTAKQLLNKNFGGPLHCLIVPATLHFAEEDMLKIWNNKEAHAHQKPALTNNHESE